MATQIKLRAWDRVTGELAPVADLSQLTDPRYEVTQYTGVLDANGVEIWEGDILRWAHHDIEEASAMYVHYLVIRHKGAFGTVDGEGHDFTPFSDMCDRYDLDNLLRRVDDVVIGTKYTQAHLLSERGEWEGYTTAPETARQYNQRALQIAHRPK